MILMEPQCAADRDSIQIDLIKLTDGVRLLRLTEPRSGLSLEKKLLAKEPLIRQKKQLLEVFDAALAQAELHAA